MNDFAARARQRVALKIRVYPCLSVVLNRYDLGGCSNRRVAQRTDFRSDATRALRVARELPVNP
jgi:hypothetical protein